GSRRSSAARVAITIAAALWCVKAANARCARRSDQSFAMPVTKDDVLAALGAVAAPDGAPLAKAGGLSRIVVVAGKVFFSIAVDAAAAPAWEPVRRKAEEAVKAIPGVVSAMVALTAERQGQVQASPGAASRGPGGPPRGRGHHGRPPVPIE